MPSLAKHKLAQPRSNDCEMKGSPVVREMILLRVQLKGQTHVHAALSSERRSWGRTYFASACLRACHLSRDDAAARLSSAPLAHTVDGTAHHTDDLLADRVISLTVDDRTHQRSHRRRRRFPLATTLAPACRERESLTARLTAAGGAHDLLSRCNHIRGVSDEHADDRQLPRTSWPIRAPTPTLFTAQPGLEVCFSDVTFAEQYDVVRSGAG
jgi:hypothetical protein